MFSQVSVCPQGVFMVGACMTGSVEGTCVAGEMCGEACIAGGMCGGGFDGRGHAWQGACVAGGGEGA